MVIAIATFRCQEDKKQDWLDWLAGEDGLVKTRAFEGCQLIVIIALRRDEHHQAYVGWRLANGLGEMLEEMLESPLEVDYYDLTDILTAAPAGGQAAMPNLRSQQRGAVRARRCATGRSRSIHRSSWRPRPSTPGRERHTPRG